MQKLWMISLAAAASAFAQQVILPVSFGTTPPLAELMQQAAESPTVPDIPRLQPDHSVPLPTLPPTTGPDSLIPGGNPAITSTFKASPILNYLGNGIGFPGFTMTGEPPDTNGAVGTTQYVQWVNSAFSIFSKAAGTLIAGPTNGNVLFSSLTGSICSNTNRGDIIANFDKLNSRWILTQFAFTTGSGGTTLNQTYGQCIAVSTTDDAAGTYHVYQYNFPDFPDYPKLGVWPDAYYITYNMFSHSTGGFVHAQACAYDAAGMRAGLPSPAAVCFAAPTNDFSLMPSDVDGTTAPPAGAPNPMWTLYDNAGTLHLYNFHVDFVTTSNSSFAGPASLSVPAFNFVCNNFAGSTATCVNQPGTTQLLDTLGDRMMYRAAYRNRAGVQSLMLNHSVDATGAPSHYTGVRWYEMRITEANSGAPYTASVFQAATQAPATSEHRWMPSIAMDKNGNVMLGYSVSNGVNTFPSIRITGRTRTEPRGFMESETNVASGIGSQVGHSRWGDYSGLTVDPVDDCTFWYTTEYFNTGNSDFAWSTRIASFKFASCQ
jgi:hypothetical protein